MECMILIVIYFFSYKGGRRGAEIV